MILHNNFDVEEVTNFSNKLGNLFTAAIPPMINTMNNHKFTIIKVDIINDLSHIVKYNIGKCRYDEVGNDIIIIK